MGMVLKPCPFLHLLSYLKGTPMFTQNGQHGERHAKLKSKFQLFIAMPHMDDIVTISPIVTPFKRTNR